MANTVSTALVPNHNFGNLKLSLIELDAEMQTAAKLISPLK